jgi:ankyrin repeat protein
MFAAELGQTGTVRLLMEKGADPTKTNLDGVSAISLAKKGGFTETEKILRGFAY